MTLSSSLKPSLLIEQLKQRCCEHIGIADRKQWRIYAASYIRTFYFVWVKEPINKVLFSLGLSSVKPISVLDLDDLFELDDLERPRADVSKKLP